MTWIVLVSSALFAISPAQTPQCGLDNTIPALIQQRKPLPVKVSIKRELVPMPLDALTAQADLVLEATVYPLKTYLSADTCYLLTDYEMRPQEVIAGGIVSTRVPGPQALTMTMFGGSTVIEGVVVTVSDDNLPLIDAGRRVMLFLKRSARDDAKFELVGSISGAFEVLSDGRIKPMIRDAEGTYLASVPRERQGFIDSVKALYRRR